MSDDSITARVRQFPTERLRAAIASGRLNPRADAICRLQLMLREDERRTASAQLRFMNIALADPDLWACVEAYAARSARDAIEENQS